MKLVHWMTIVSCNISEAEVIFFFEHTELFLCTYGNPSATWSADFEVILNFCKLPLGL
jgi:hypothetical protein